MSSDREEDTSLQQDDSEDEFDWEEVEVPEHEPQHLEITFQAHPKPADGASLNKSVIESRGRRTELTLLKEERNISCRTSYADRCS